MDTNPHAVADTRSGVSLYQVGPEGWPMVDGKPCADCVAIGETTEGGRGLGESYIVRKGECAVHEAARVAWLTDMRQCHGPGTDAVRIAGEWSSRCSVATVGNGAYCHGHDMQMARLQTVGLDGIKVKSPEVLRPLRPRKTEEEVLAGAYRQHACARRFDLVLGEAAGTLPALPSAPVRLCSESGLREEASAGAAGARTRLP